MLSCEDKEDSITVLTKLDGLYINEFLASNSTTNMDESGEYDDWLADKFGLDVSGLRILFIAAIVIGIGSPILIYFILYLVKPNEY